MTRHAKERFPPVTQHGTCLGPACLDSLCASRECCGPKTCQAVRGTLTEPALHMVVGKK